MLYWRLQTSTIGANATPVFLQLGTAKTRSIPSLFHPTGGPIVRRLHVPTVLCEALSDDAPNEANKCNAPPVWAIDIEVIDGIGNLDNGRSIGWSQGFVRNIAVSNSRRIWDVSVRYDMMV